MKVKDMMLEQTHHYSSRYDRQAARDEAVQES